MSRRSYKTINLPREVVNWIDDLLDPDRRGGRPGPLGIESRDEFVRIAVAILGAAISQDDRNGPPLVIINRLLFDLERAQRQDGTAKSPSSPEQAEKHGRRDSAGAP